MAGISLFNEEWYLREYPDVAKSVADGLTDARTHFEQFGAAEGRSPGPLFDAAAYLVGNPDVNAAFKAGSTTPYDHFVQHGAAEGRSPAAYLDVAFYLQRNQDVASSLEASGMTAVEHFLQYGQYEGRAISPFIDLGAYLQANGDVAAAAANGVSPTAHLLTFGFAEARDLGNGVSLAQFANDPVFQQAIGPNGSAFDALARVAEVSPFLPTFIAPEGWEAPANTPIPLDFKPVGDEKLEIPPSVTVPDDVELPDDVFKPVEPEEPVDPEEPEEPVDEVSTELGVKVSDVASKPGTDTLWVGAGNSNDNFAVSTTSESQFELALKGYARGQGDTELDLESAAYNIGATQRAGFIYSLAALDGASLKEKLDAGYSFFLKIDVDGSEGTDFVTFRLEAEQNPPGSSKPNDSGYQWVNVADESIVITDDEGGAGVSSRDSYAEVTQNVQTPIWYADGLQIGNSGVLKGGDYVVALEVVKGEEQVVEQAITLEVDALDISYDAALSGFATKGDGTMLNGSGNLASNFAVHQIALDAGETEGAEGDAAPAPVLEVALGGQQRGGAVYEMSDDGVIAVPAGEVPTFKFSIGTDGEAGLAELLQTYDIRLLVDTDASAATDFITLTAQAGEAGTGGALEWAFGGAYAGTYRLTDDGGNDSVSQNIQALGWYQPNDAGELFKSPELGEAGQGQYTVAIEVYEKGGVQLVGATQVVFDIAEIGV